jgi:HCOMODA/2-hydroxy-3-carboxy-muconic semialdehyde decarboxylase
VTKTEPLRSIFHISAFLGVTTPVFEIRELRGDGTDMLIRDAELGRALAAGLGSGNVILMRGHGATVVGASLRQAVIHAVYTELNARLQAQAMQLGPVTYLSAAEARAAAITNEAHGDRAWDLWKAQARRALGR